MWMWPSCTLLGLDFAVFTRALCITSLYLHLRNCLKQSNTSLLIPQSVNLDIKCRFQTLSREENVLLISRLPIPRKL
jgi:hypothetical protein